ncbi:ATP-dependent zinc metalloprotease FtsH [Lutimonas saemankumensis]|uniref:ATP-dependent zinc metalloprotease FtsH n=1 Tax=Lutimonas saemankumensis TaxID=483016 RepID=UPI001CD37970|nr:ATP-dependent zinc metalloprotease FtsH [Lutimonas saemankumensis]MCA0933302.1 ATP-dependent zinc metalloprotease FtsH [Lutimonas saemankumensis]
MLQQNKKKSQKPLNEKGPFNRQNRRKPMFWFYTLLFMILATLLLTRYGYGPREISWLEFEQEMLTQNDVEKIEVINQSVANIYIKQDRLSNSKYEELKNKFTKSSSGPHYIIQIGSIESFEEKLEKAQANTVSEDKVPIRYVNQIDWTNILYWIIPFALIFFFWMILLGRMASKGRTGTLFNFTKTTAKITTKETKSKITFDDVAGLKEAKTEIMEIVDFLKNPEHYTKLGAKIPRGVMLVGPPGTGKTLLAKAVAGEAKVPFFFLSGSEFVEMFVGVGASRVRDLFKKAKENTPSIIFIDEIDAVGRSRNRGNFFQSNDERENTLNQLLAELDGFGVNTGVIVLAATNRADILDKALLRPGRFDRHIYLELPSKEERIEIFKVHIRPLKKAKDINIDEMAALCPGFSGADIANICNEAALIAARKKRNQVHQEDFLMARDRIVGGLERKNKITSSKEKEIIAYHEAGHAVASWHLRHVDSLMKVSIIPRGKSLGSAWYLPEERQIVTRSQFIDQICASLGGRVAEEIVFGDVSSGALDDLEKVTKQAYSMVAYFGLDEEIGPISFYDSTGKSEQQLVKPYSEDMAQKIDKEVQNLITSCYERTKKLLLDHQDELEVLTQLLITKEVVEKDELERIMGKRQRSSNQKEEQPH